MLWLAALPIALFSLLVWALGAYPLPWQISVPWVPQLGVALAFRVDGLSALMLALIFGIGSGVFVYASAYLVHEPKQARLLGVLVLFMLAMAGAVSADNIFVLFLFWELTSITSFLLVGFNHRHAAVRASARQALLVTMGGGLALLGGLILLGQMANTSTLSGIVAAGPMLIDDPRLPYALVLVLLGAFTKSAQFPFHFWLPNAMSAPTPVSAYLHSATMVKLGIYLMARLDPAFNALLFWEVLLIGTGTITAVWAAVLALRERDLKRILARSTVSALGTLTLLIGLPSPGAGLAAIAFLFAHALYKAPLFMVAGNIDHATGTRIIDHLMGLRRAMPWTAAVAVLAGLSMAGLPLSFGFVAKDAVSAAKAEADIFALVSYATVFVNAIAVAVAGVAAVRIFWGPPKTTRKTAHEASWRMLLPPFLIVLVGMEIDFFPALADTLLLSAARVVSPELGTVALTAGLDLQVLLSATGATVLVGLLLFFAWDRLHAGLNRLHWLDRYGPAAAYERILRGVAELAAWQTRRVQSGRLGSYLYLTIAGLLILGAAAWLAGGPLPTPVWRWDAHGWAWLAAGLFIVAGALAAAGLRDRLALLMASGLVGYGSAVLFLFAGAPDLAFTQFLVETIFVVVAASVLPHYATRPSTPPAWRKRDLALALAAGAGIFVLLLTLTGLPVERTLADWFGSHSLPAAKGYNVVNVIIVDFRALDTLGEIAVVAFSLLAALPLLAGLRERRAP